MWQTELGVTVNLSNQDWNVFLKSRKDGDFQIARNGWIADYNDPCSFLDMWYTGGGNNDAQYSNPEYDALIDAAKATSDQTERMAAFHKAEDLLIGQDSVLAPIYFYTNPYMLSDNIERYVLHSAWIFLLRIYPAELMIVKIMAQAGQETV